MFVLSLAVAFADDSVKRDSSLGKSADVLVCKIDFTLAVLNAYQSVFNASNFSSSIVALGKDKVQLQSLISADNASSVREFVKNTLDNDLKFARMSIEDVRSTSHKDLSKEQKQSLKDAYKRAQESLTTCQRSGLKTLGDKRVGEFTKILDQHLTLADRFAAKGIDVSGMKKVIEDAKTQVITPLKDALAKANSTEEVQAAVRKYCLFNGCKNGVNFHFAAKFESEKLSAILNYIRANNISVSDDKISKVQGSITSTRAMLVEIGSAQYTNDAKNVRNSIQKAYGDLKDVRVKAATAKARMIVAKEVKNNEQKR